jgi:peptide chain release factor 2
LIKSRSVFDPAELNSRILELEDSLTKSDVWDNQEKARGITRSLHAAKTKLKRFNDLSQSLEDVETMIELCSDSEADEGLSDLNAEFNILTEHIEEAEMATYLTGPHDESDAIIAIHPGAGGTESCDWAQMLMRMFTRWAEKEGFTVKELDMIPGDLAGIKSVTLQISGDYAYGFLQAERGVHRLVRISPFDSASRRHTSFASVDVWPEVEDDTDIEIDPDDLRIDTFRASSAGGQHVNTTDSAVRITHLPTKIVASCQNERSQHSNRVVCMRILKARLLQQKLREQEEAMAAIKGEQMDIGFGSQIRSYVLQPYTVVKDHRTGSETSSVDKVLDGDLSFFMRAYLTWKGRNETP